MLANSRMSATGWESQGLTGRALSGVLPLACSPMVVKWSVYLPEFLSAEAVYENPEPWWFSGAVGVAGVVGGILIKWLIDLIGAKRISAREDKLRFIYDKRVAYADLLTACSELADVFHESRRLTLEGRILDAKPHRAREEIEEYNSDIDKNSERRENAYQELNRAASVVELVAPENVVAAARLFVSRATHPHNLDRRRSAEVDYIDAVRADLGYGAISHAPAYNYEETIEADHPDSGLEIKTVDGAQEVSLSERTSDGVGR